MQDFYVHLNQFLLDAGLESSTAGLGCTEAEIAKREQQYGVQFPLAYRLFLQWCGRGRLQSLNQGFQLEFLDYYWDSARDLLADNQATLEPGGFVFSEWQGYNFFYFLLGVDNPPVKLCIVQYNTEPGLEYVECGRFTDWLISLVESTLKCRQLNTPAMLAELNRIEQLAD